MIGGNLCIYHTLRSSNIFLKVMMEEHVRIDDRLTDISKKLDETH